MSTTLALNRKLCYDSAKCHIGPKTRVEAPLNRFFGYFQIAALALFLGLFLGRTLHLRIKQRINPIVLDAGKKRGRGHIALGLFAGVNAWAAVTLWHALHSAFQSPAPPLFQPRLDAAPLQVTGATLIILGFVLFIWALIDLGNSWRLGIDEARPGTLVTGGVYALSRHPIYLFFHLYFAGTFLINGTIPLLILAIVLGLILHAQALQEEQFLNQIHGPAYRAYCEHTARYLNWAILLPQRREKAPLSDQ